MALHVLKIILVREVRKTEVHYGYESYRKRNKNHRDQHG